MKAIHVWLLAAVLGLACIVGHFQASEFRDKQKFKTQSSFMCGEYGNQTSCDFAMADAMKAANIREGFYFYLPLALLIALLVGGIYALLSTPDPLRLFASAISRNDVNYMAEKLESGEIDPNGLGPDDRSSWLRYAIEQCGLEQCRVLVAAGADPRKEDGRGGSPLGELRNVSVEESAPSLVAIRALFEAAPIHDTSSEQVADRSASQVPRDDDPTVVGQLMQLARLREAGHLSAAEFDAAKAQALARG